MFLYKIISTVKNIILAILAVTVSSTNFAATLPTNEDLIPIKMDVKAIDAILAKHTKETYEAPMIIVSNGADHKSKSVAIRPKDWNKYHNNKIVEYSKSIFPKYDTEYRYSVIFSEIDCYKRTVLNYTVNFYATGKYKSIQGSQDDLVDDSRIDNRFCKQ